MCAVPTHNEETLQSTHSTSQCANSGETNGVCSSEDVVTSISAALEAIKNVMEWKGKEIRAQEHIVAQLKRGVEEELPDGLLASVNQAETAMKIALREMRWRVESFKKEAADLSEHLANQLADVDRNIITLTKMERSLTPLIIEETRYRNPQRLPRSGKSA